MGFTCSICGRWHDDELLDVRARLPEEVLALDEAERERRVVTSPGGDFTSILDTDRHFVRALVELPIDNESYFGWGVWVRVSRDDVADIAQRWTDPASFGRTYPAELATDIAAYPDTVGLPGTLTLRDPDLLPVFLLDASEHRLVGEQHAGISVERARELAEPYRVD